MLHRLYQQYWEFMLCAQSAQITNYAQDAVWRMMLFFFNITAVKQDWAAWSTATKQSSFDYEIASQLALAVFAASCVPDILAKNWRHLMQGHSAHYLALSALLYFGADPIQPPIHIGLIGLVNIPDFLSKDIASMLSFIKPLRNRGTKCGKLPHRPRVRGFPDEHAEVTDLPCNDMGSGQR